MRAGAACFTGWRLDRTTNAFIVDPQAAQQFARRRSSGTRSTPASRSSTSSPTAVRRQSYVPAAFWSHLAYPVTTQDPVVADLSPGYAADLNIANLLRAIFQHPAFVSNASLTGLIKQPTEYVVGAASGPRGVTPPASGRAGCRPPWPASARSSSTRRASAAGSQNEYWLSTAAALARWEFAHRLATSRRHLVGGRRSRRRPGRRGRRPAVGARVVDHHRGRPRAGGGQSRDADDPGPGLPRVREQLRSAMVHIPDTTRSRLEPPRGRSRPASCAAQSADGASWPWPAGVGAAGALGAALGPRAWDALFGGSAGVAGAHWAPPPAGPWCC